MSAASILNKLGQLVKKPSNGKDQTVNAIAGRVIRKDNADANSERKAEKIYNDKDKME